MKNIIAAVEKMLAAEQEFYHYVNDLGELKTGNLTLGGSSLFSSWILPQIMGRFSRKYPMVKISLVEESTSRLEELLQNGGVDLMMDNCELDSAVFDSCVYQKEHLFLRFPRLCGQRETSGVCGSRQGNPKGETVGVRDTAGSPGIFQGRALRTSETG